MTSLSTLEGYFLESDFERAYTLSYSELLSHLPPLPETTSYQLSIALSPLEKNPLLEK